MKTLLAALTLAPLPAAAQQPAGPLLPLFDAAD
jgi:hypothetical protein